MTKDKRPSMERGSKIDWNVLNSFRVQYNDFETNYIIPSDIGRGSIKEFRFKTGLDVYIHDYVFFKPVAILNDDNWPSLAFWFCISDCMKLDIACLKEELMVNAWESGIFCFPNTKSCHDYMPKTHTCKIIVLVDPSFFELSMGDDTAPFPFDLKAIADPGKDVYEPYHSTDIVTPSMRLIMEQILRCPYEGIIRRIFIEGKAMELLACKLDQINQAGKNRNSNSPLKAHDIDKIYFAGNFLTGNIASAPNTNELAKAIGMSRTKLYHGFNQLYGVSPMEYLRLQRLEKAKELVQNKELNMTEIAHTLGYSSASHFAKAFKAFYGISPSHYRRTDMPM